MRRNESELDQGQFTHISVAFIQLLFISSHKWELLVSVFPKFSLRFYNFQGLRTKSSIEAKKLLYYKGDTQQSKETIQCENIFANYATDRGLISRIYEELKKLINNTIANNPVKKCTKGLNRHFSKEEIQVTNRQTHEKMLSITSH